MVDSSGKRLLALWVLAAVGLSGCGPRGAVTINSEAAAVGAVEPILVATSRSGDGGRNVWAFARSSDLEFARFAVSVPPDREPGTVIFPGNGAPDPRTEFLTVSAQRIAGRDGFVRAINAGLARLPRESREAIVFTHGFNTNFAEGLYRHAQMAHDFGTPGLSVHYSWPSAATVRAYGLDRESAIFARDGLQETLDAVAASDADRVIVAAHSMGAMVLMETLRTMAISQAAGAEGARFFDKLQAVVLMAPDLDIDVFRRQAAPLIARGAPVYVFYSSRDRALRVSSILRGQEARLGSIRDVAQLGDLPLTLIDTSGFADGEDALGHFAVATSPSMIAVIQGMDRIGGRIFDDAAIDPNLFETTVNVVRGVTDVVLQPLAP